MDPVFKELAHLAGSVIARRWLAKHGRESPMQPSQARKHKSRRRCPKANTKKRRRA